MAIDSSLENLVSPCREKAKVVKDVVDDTYANVAPFETTRTIARQKYLMYNTKSTRVSDPVASYHVKKKAVDRVFLDKKWQPKRSWDYNYLQKIGRMCWMTGIYNKKKQLIESCHLQDDWRSIEKVMKDNSAAWEKASPADRKLLSLVNWKFREILPKK